MATNVFGQSLGGQEGPAITQLSQYLDTAQDRVGPRLHDFVVVTNEEILVLHWPRDLGHEADVLVVSSKQGIRHVVSNTMSNDGLSGRG